MKHYKKYSKNEEIPLHSKENKSKANTQIISEETNSESFVLLDPMEFTKWSNKQVCSLLCSSSQVGGADLNLDEVELIFNAEYPYPSNFLDFIFLLLGKDSNGKDDHVIISHLSHQLQASLKDVGISISTQLADRIVSWVKETIRPRCYDWWPHAKMKEELEKAGVTDFDLSSLCLPISEWLIRLPLSDQTKVTEWINKMKFPVKINPHFNVKPLTPSFIVSARSSPQFNFLRNLKNNPKKLSELEKMVGNFIELPQLDQKYSAKESKTCDWKMNISFQKDIIHRRHIC